MDSDEQHPESRWVRSRAVAARTSAHDSQVDKNHCNQKASVAGPSSVNTSQTDRYDLLLSSNLP